MDLSKPFERITMVDAVKKYAGVDFNEVKDTAAGERSLQMSITSSTRSVTKRAIS